MNIWPITKISTTSAALALLGTTLTSLPSAAEPVVSCADDICTVTFSYVGSVQSFAIPSNAKNLSFEALGAQGGKSGGGGGKVTGVFTSIPEIIYVAVGGAGITGSFAAGGFNGGGTAGSASGMEGSGGGATDIRLTPDTSSRVVVAGGGGGRGAGLGSSGGVGGGLVAGDGKTGQGFGGKGGSQQTAGLGGAANGTGSAGGAGSLGVGGPGGSSSLYGGGGGGGGYFGGGGGGSDTDSCCSDAGGGGGGSSYTDQTLITQVIHTQGIRPGNGLLTLTYQLSPTVVSFATGLSLTNQSDVQFELEFNQSVVGLTESDFTVIHSSGSCEALEIAGTGSSYSLQATGCDDGRLELSLSADSVSNLQTTGPINAKISNSILIDTQLPSISWTNTTPELVTLQFNESIQGLDESDLVIQSDIGTCQIEEISQISNFEFEIAISQCQQSSFDIQLQAESVIDAAGNLGPANSSMTSFAFPSEPTPESSSEPTSESTPESSSESTPESSSESTQESTPEPSPTDSEVPQQSEPESSPTEQSEPAQAQPESPNPEPSAEANTVAPVQPSPVNFEYIELEFPTEELPELAATTPEEPSPAKMLPQDPRTGNSGEKLATKLDQILGSQTPRPKQAAARLIVPAQQVSEPSGFNPWATGLMIIGVFGLLAGLILSRRLLPLNLVS